MKLNTKKLAALASVGFGLAIGVSATLLMGADKPAPAKPAPQSIMRGKLGHAQNLLEALAMEDFDKIRTETKALKTLSTVDEWKKFDTIFYTQLSGEFRAALDKMSLSAKAGNLDGATIGFNQMTNTCVQCHALIRDGGILKGLEEVK